MEPALDGRVVGHIEIVNTGETVAVTDVADLLALIGRVANLEFVDE
jgi:hypothetical protein